MGRFVEGDLLPILEHQNEHDRVEPTRRSEARTPQPGDSAWSGFGSV
ncbi:hypothetical protein [Microbispora bryophytorum]|uniref:Uncharacterized protein n=1 Tax=Microbispora bryophytorum subsp. camponoti TaxID=1677852 RepID=A0ABR8LIG1_9ACTN|nr:hypothetical protein [Microbispora camponoti]MBD3148273.1 hypothetical protein [Microbispora camponoti]